MKADKKKMKAFLTNEISNRYSNRIKELENSIKINRANYNSLWARYSTLLTENENLKEEIIKLKDWNDRLMEFFDMDENMQRRFIRNLKTQDDFNKTMDQFLKFAQIFNIR